VLDCQKQEITPTSLKVATSIKGGDLRLTLSMTTAVKCTRRQKCKKKKRKKRIDQICV